MKDGNNTLCTLHIVAAVYVFRVRKLTASICGNKGFLYFLGLLLSPLLNNFNIRRFCLASTPEYAGLV